MEMRFFMLLLLLASCKSIPQGTFVPEKEEVSPDYSNLDNWAATPMTEDKADMTPGNNYQNLQDDAEVDVFFIHPTSYTKERGNTDWNAAIADKEINKKTDEGTIQFQASVFNGVSKIYAPRYRQAHIYAYFTEDDPQEKLNAKKAFNLAYSDVAASFKYYLDNWNEGRPIIIASHSQGTTHALRLIKEYFEGQPLMDKLVAAYLVGMPVRKSTFPTLQPCQDADETGCFVTWRSYQRGFLPKWHESGSDIVVTNPLSWKTDTAYVGAEQNKGTLLFNFEKGVKPGIADAQIYEDHLWVNKPKFRGSVFLTIKNYHFADYNLFYADIRQNAKDRVSAFIEKENQ
jgi:hypothetical protein